MKPLHSTAADKIGMFRERLTLCHQRLMRHKAFAPRQVGGRKRESIKVIKQADCGTGRRLYYSAVVRVVAWHNLCRGPPAQLTAVDALGTKRGELNVLAMLTQREEGRFYFEDLSGIVEIDLSDTVRQSHVLHLACTPPLRLRVMHQSHAFCCVC